MAVYGYTVYGYEVEIEELLDSALNELSPEDYQTLLDHLDQMITERQDG